MNRAKRSLDEDEADFKRDSPQGDASGEAEGFSEGDEQDDQEDESESDHGDNSRDPDYEVSSSEGEEDEDEADDEIDELSDAVPEAESMNEDGDPETGESGEEDSDDEHNGSSETDYEIEWNDEDGEEDDGSSSDSDFEIEDNKENYERENEESGGTGENKWSTALRPLEGRQLPPRKPLTKSAEPNIEGSPPSAKQRCLRSHASEPVPVAGESRIGEECQPTSKTRQKKTTPRRKPRRKLTQHLKELSKERQNVYAMFLEWLFLFAQRLDSFGECPCGQDRLLWYFHIKNRKTGKQTRVGSHCIHWFGRSMKTVARVAYDLLYKGIVGNLTEKGRGSRANLKLEINTEAQIVLERSVIEHTYRSMPLMMLRDAGSMKAVLIAKPAENIPQERIDKMKVGNNYKIRVRLITEIDDKNQENHLTAEVTQISCVPKRILMPADVKQFIQS